MFRIIIVNLNTLLSWIMKIALFGLVIVAILKGLGIMLIVSIAIALVCSFLPAMLNHNYKVNLPWIVDFWVTLALFLHSFGIAFNLYHMQPYEDWWDKMTHLLTTALIAMLAFFVVFTLNYVKKVKMSIPMIGLFTFVFTIAIGALWEVVEFYSDIFLKTRSVINLEDSMNDLVFDCLGGAISAFLGALYVKHEKRAALSQALRPVIKILTHRRR